MVARQSVVAVADLAGSGTHLEIYIFCVAKGGIDKDMSPPYAHPRLYQKQPPLRRLQRKFWCKNLHQQQSMNGAYQCLSIFRAVSFVLKTFTHNITFKKFALYSQFKISCSKICEYCNTCIFN